MDVDNIKCCWNNRRTDNPVQIEEVERSRKKTGESRNREKKVDSDDLDRLKWASATRSFFFFSSSRRLLRAAARFNCSTIVVMDNFLSQMTAAGGKRKGQNQNNKREEPLQ